MCVCALLECDKLLYLIEPQFLYQQHRDKNSSYLTGLLCGLHKTLHVKFLEQCLVLQKHLLKVKYSRNYELFLTLLEICLPTMAFPIFHLTQSCLEREKDHPRNWNLMLDACNRGGLEVWEMLVLSLVVGAQGVRGSEKGRTVQGSVTSVQEELISLKFVVGRWKAIEGF